MPPFSATQFAHWLLKRTNNSAVSKIIHRAIVVVVLVIAILSLGGLAFWFYRRRRMQQHNPMNANDSAHVKIVGSGSISVAPPQQSCRQSRAAPYAPTTEFGQYQPPLPTPAHYRARSQSYQQHLKENSLP